MSFSWLRDYFRNSDTLPRIVLIVAIAISGLPLLVVGMYRNSTDPETKSHQINLEREFRAIKHLPGTKELNYESSQKRGLAYAGATYETDLVIEEAHSYYDHQLVTNGWLFYEDHGLRSYCKGKYKATLRCEQQVSTSRCEIVLKWGFESLVERYITGEKYRARGCD